MTGQRHQMDSAGASYQDFAKAVLGRITSVIEVPRERDFGIDFYCQSRVSLPDGLETVADICGVQVKGGDEELEYGGIKGGNWRGYEFAWLKTLTTPLYLARVNKSLSHVQLFPLQRLWRTFWTIGQANHPFHVRFQTGSPNSAIEPLPDVSRKPVQNGLGDAHVTTIPLGPPILELTMELLSDLKFRALANEILAKWVWFDTLNLIRFRQFVPWFMECHDWITNRKSKDTDFLPFNVKDWQFWNPGRGENLFQLANAALPVVVNLGVHLQWQDDPAAFDFIPVLKWLGERKVLGPMGEGLLQGLLEAQSKGVSPAKVLSPQ